MNNDDVPVLPSSQPLVSGSCIIFDDLLCLLQAPVSKLLIPASKPSTSTSGVKSQKRKHDDEDSDNEGDDEDDDDGGHDDDDVDDGEQEEELHEPEVSDTELELLGDLDEESGTKNKGRGKGKSTSKRARQKPLILPRETAENIFEWIKENECLYHRGKDSFLDRDVKKVLWDTKAAELDKQFPDKKITGTTLMKWYFSKRTMYVKAKKDEHKSGSGSQVELTEAKQWLLKQLTFIDSHVFQKPGRQASCQVSQQALIL